MSWQVFIILSILLFSFNNLFHKVIMRHEQSDPYAHTIAFYGLGGVFAFIIALVIHGKFQYIVPISILPYFIPLAVFATLAPLLMFHAVKRIDASEVSILVSTQRLWLVLASFILLHEAFSIHKLLGTLVILFGIGIALWNKKHFRMNIEVVFILLAAFFFGLTDAVSYFILRNFDAASFVVYVCFIPVILLSLFKPKTLKKLSFYLKPRYSLAIIFLTLCDTLATLFAYYAYQVGRNGSQIAPLLAVNTMLSVIFAILILKERKNLLNKIAGAIVVVVGIILVTILH